MAYKRGDRVRVVAIPDAIMRMPPEARDGPDGTLTVLRQIMTTGAICEVVEISRDTGWPWIAQETHDARGPVHHKLVIEPECIALIDSMK